MLTDDFELDADMELLICSTPYEIETMQNRENLSLLEELDDIEVGI